MIFTVSSWLKRSPKNHEKCSVSLNVKPDQIMKSCFTIVVLGGMLRQKKIIKSKKRNVFL